MKHPPILLLLLFPVALLINSAQAQTTPNVCRARLYFADYSAEGSLVISGNALVFIDDRPMGGVIFSAPTGDSEALSIDKSKVASINRQSGIFSVYTKDIVEYRSRREKHITFRFTSTGGNCDSIVRWPGSIPPAKRGPGLPPKSKPRSTRAKLRRPMRPDVSGDLVISISNDTITFGNRGKGRYQWGPRDLRDLQQEGACVLLITPFVGGELKFDLEECIGLPDFRKIRAHFLR